MLHIYNRELHLRGTNKELHYMAGILSWSFCCPESLGWSVCWGLQHFCIHYCIKMKAGGTSATSYCNYDKR